MKTLILVILAILGASVMAGQAYADINWGYGGSVITGYDDNVTYSNTDQIRDMVTRTSLNGGFHQVGANDTLNFETGITENIYTDHSQYDNLSEDLKTDYKGDIGPYEHLIASDNFTHSKDPSSLENAFGRINGDYGTYYNNYVLGSTTDITEQLSGIVKYIQTNYNYTLDSLSNSALYNPEVSAKYDFSSESQGTLNYDYRRRSFSPGGSSDANTPSAGWRQYLNSQWYVDLLTGVDFIKGFGENTVKPRYGVGLTHDVDQNTELTLKYNKQSESDQYTQEINNDWYLVLNGYHEFTQRISGDIAFFTGQGKYDLIEVKDQFIGTNVSAKYTVNDHMDFTINYSLQDNTSNSSNRASTQNTIFLGVDYKL